MPILRIIRGTDAGREFDFSGREVTIGRLPVCQIVLPSRTVSRQHARILCHEDQFEIEDLGSVNGTRVNGQRIRGRAPLQPGDEIKIHDLALQFLLESPEADEAAEEHGSTPATGPGEELVPGVHSTIVSTVDIASSGSQEVQADAKLSAVLEISRALGSSLNLDEILNRILDGLFEIFPQAQKGYIVQIDDLDESMPPRAIKHRGDTSDTISPVSMSVARRVIHEAAAFLSSDGDHDELLEDYNASVFEEEIRSLMCAPLIGPSKLAQGVVQIETGDPQHPFQPEDLQVLASVAMLAGQAVEYANVHNSLVKLEAESRDIELAKGVQQRFLPQIRPNVPGYVFYDYYSPANMVAGDYYDYIKMPDGRLAIAIGDVSGKGVPAALMMARLCSDVRYCLLSTPSPARAMGSLSEQLEVELRDGAFTTLLLLLLDPRHHRVTCVNAGHPPPVVLRAATGSASFLSSEQSGPPLGVDPKIPYDEQRIDLAPNDLLLAFTDGIHEAFDPEKRMYGLKAITDVVERCDGHPVHVGRALISDVRRFAQGRLQSDDMCVVSFGRSQPEAMNAGQQDPEKQERPVA